MRLLTLLLFSFAAFGQARQIAVISHRGEHLRHTENTLPAFQAAIDAGADYFEVDVRTTSDGRHVLMHDASVDRTTKASGKIAEMTFDQVRALRAGTEPVPTFEEALSMARGRCGIYVDSKAISAKALIEALESQKMLDKVVVYGGVNLLKEVQALRPQVRIMPESVNLTVVQQIVTELKPQVIAFGARDFQDDIIRVARDSGAGVFVDRLGSDDTEKSWQDAIDRGATGIQTDHPAELVQYLRSKGLHK